MKKKVKSFEDLLLNSSFTKIEQSTLKMIYGGTGDGDVEPKQSGFKPPIRD